MSEGRKDEGKHLILDTVIPLTLCVKRDETMKTMKLIMLAWAAMLSDREWTLRESFR